jgi:hypothetical protein
MRVWTPVTKPLSGPHPELLNKLNAHAEIKIKKDISSTKLDLFIFIVPSFDQFISFSNREISIKS